MKVRDKAFVRWMIAEVEAAFLATGLEPVKHGFGDGRRIGCAVTALDAAERGLWPEDTNEWSNDPDEMLAERLRQRFGGEWSSFVDGLMLGFDHGLECNRFQRLVRSYHLGRVAGHLARRRVFSKARKEIPAEMEVCR